MPTATEVLYFFNGMFLGVIIGMALILALALAINKNERKKK